MKTANCHPLLVCVPAAILWCSLAAAEEAKTTDALEAEIRSLQKERIATLQQLVELGRNRWNEGAEGFESVRAAHLELLDAELDGATNLKERTELVSKQLVVVEEVVKLVDARFQAGNCDYLHILQAKSLGLHVKASLLKLQLEQRKQGAPEH